MTYWAKAYLRYTLRTSTLEQVFVGVCMCACSIYLLLIVQSSNLETLIKFYYQRNGFHLLSFYNESIAFVCLYVWVWVKENGVGMSHVCVFLRMYMDVLLCVPYVVGQNALPLWNSVHTTDDMKWPPRSARLTSHQCCYLWSNTLCFSCGFWVNELMWMGSPEHFIIAQGLN